MLSLVNATIPAAQNTTRPSTMIALRVRPKTRSDLIKGLPVFVDLAHDRASLGVAEQELVAQEHRAVGDHGFAWLQAIEDLHPALLAYASAHDALYEMPAVAGGPHCHRAVTFPDHTRLRHGERAHRVADANNETCVHA